jgi:dihydrofolate reductase
MKRDARQNFCSVPGALVELFISAIHYVEDRVLVLLIKLSHVRKGYRLSYIFIHMVAIVAAVAKNGVIGAKNDLPWYLPEDLKRFKQITTGKTVVMGRKTFESILARLKKPLPNRDNVVITRNKEYKVPEGVVTHADLKTALREHGSSDIFIIGGGEIFNQSIGLADTLYITHVDKEVEGDVYFPQIDQKKWRLESNEPHEGYSFALYKRI